MPGYTLPLTESRIIADLMKRQRGTSIALTSSTAGDVQVQYDRWALTGTPSSTYTLSFTPLPNAVWLFLNGLELDEGTDYTADYTAGTVTVTATLTAGDVLGARYLYSTGAPPVRPTNPLSYVGVPLHPTNWAVRNPYTMGYRSGGVWTYSTATAPGATLEPNVDAYSVEATITAVGANTNVLANQLHLAAAVNQPDATSGSIQTGIEWQANSYGSTCTLYLFHNGSQVITTGTVAMPVVGDTIKIVTDFTTHIATEYVNGTARRTIDFSAQTWFTPDGSLA